MCPHLHSTVGLWGSLQNTIGIQLTAYHRHWCLICSRFVLNFAGGTDFLLRREEAVRQMRGCSLWGGYIHGGTYSIKPGTYGIQGPLLGAGALWGYEFPLYTYRHFSIDFELGFAAGLGVTSYTGYSLNRSGSDYIRVPERSKGLHLCPFPIVSELRACFVFRSLSVREKYKKVDAKKLILRQERDEAKRLEAERRKEIKAEKKALRQQQRALRNADVHQKGKRK